MTNTILKKSIKRQRQFFKSAVGIYTALIIFTLFFACYNFNSGFTNSGYAALFAIFGYIISATLLIGNKQFVLGTYIVYLTLGPAAVVASYHEGIMSGNFWFLLTMFFVIPFMIRQENYFVKEITRLYVITTTLLLILFIVSPWYPNPELQVPLRQTHQKFVIISIVCFCVILIFSFLAVISGKVYLKRVQEARHRAEKETRTRVLSNIGHELRTQINSINGITQLILERQNLNPDDKQYAEILDYCNNNMLFLVNDMLDMHKIEAGRFELFKVKKSLGDLLTKTALPFVSKAEEKTLKLVTDIDKDLLALTVEIDDARLTQVFHNLLSNAIKFTDVGVVKFKAIKIDESTDKVEIRFSISDTGVGISPENHNKIFESFRQIKDDNKPVYGGTGLGLSISKTIVEKMGSQIQVKSNLNQGTTFYFTLTLDKVETQKITRVLSNTSDNYLQNKTILIVEDNAVSMMFANRLLKTNGAKTYQAVDGIEAIVQVEKHNDIDIVLLDLEMPRLNGFKAISKIKAIRPELIVIAFTANIPAQEVIDKLANLGFDDIISKPFKKEDVYKVLKKYVNPNGFSSLFGVYPKDN